MDVLCFSLSTDYETILCKMKCEKTKTKNFIVKLRNYKLPNSQEIKSC